MEEATSDRRSYSKATIRTIRKRYIYLKKNFGAVTPRVIVDDARDKASPLHRFFDWSDSSAAEKYRLIQAGEIMRRVYAVIEKDGKPEPLRVYASVVRDGQRSYEELTEVMKDPVTKRQLLDAMKRDLDAVLRRYETMSFAAKSMKLVRAAIDALDEEETAKAA